MDWGGARKITLSAHSFTQFSSISFFSSLVARDIHSGPLSIPCAGGKRTTTKNSMGLVLGEFQSNGGLALFVQGLPSPLEPSPAAPLTHNP